MHPLNSKSVNRGSIPLCTKSQIQGSDVICLISYDKTGLDNKRRKVVYTKLFQAFCRKEFCLSARSAFEASKILSNLNSNYYLKCFYLFLLSFTKLGKITKRLKVRNSWACLGQTYCIWILCLQLTEAQLEKFGQRGRSFRHIFLAKGG